LLIVRSLADSAGAAASHHRAAGDGAPTYGDASSITKKMDDGAMAASRHSFDTALPQFARKAARQAKRAPVKAGALLARNRAALTCRH
jgi:hypothetical protein